MQKPPPSGNGDMKSPKNMLPNPALTSVLPSLTKIRQFFEASSLEFKASMALVVLTIRLTSSGEAKNRMTSGHARRQLWPMAG